MAGDGCLNLHDSHGVAGDGCLNLHDSHGVLGDGFWNLHYSHGGSENCCVNLHDSHGVSGDGFCNIHDSHKCSVSGNGFFLNTHLKQQKSLEYDVLMKTPHLQRAEIC